MSVVRHRVEEAAIDSLLPFWKITTQYGHEIRFSAVE